MIGNDFKVNVHLHTQACQSSAAAEDYVFCTVRQIFAIIEAWTMPSVWIWSIIDMGYKPWSE